MNFTERLLQEFDAEMNSTRKMLEAVPEEKLAWKPHEKSMTLARLAGHIAELPNWALHAIQVDTLELRPGQKAFQPASKGELLAAFEKNVSEARPVISGLKEEQLATIWRLKFGGQTVIEMPRSAVIRATVMNHLVHHRGQLSVYLRLLEVAVPGVYGPSADEMGAFSRQPKPEN